MPPGAQRYGSGGGVVRALAGELRACPGRLHPPLGVEVGLMKRVPMPVVTALATAGLGLVLLAGAGPDILQPGKYLVIFSVVPGSSTARIDA
jgi:hypothetical protein